MATTEPVAIYLSSGMGTDDLTPHRRLADGNAVEKAVTTGASAEQP